MAEGDAIQKTAARKRELIRRKQQLISESLIYAPPDPALLYSDEELFLLLSPLVGEQIPKKLGPVQKSHYVKRKLLDSLGYTVPSGFRTKQARAHRPRFVHQLIDVFVQSSNNLQVWNYIPSAELPLPYGWNEVEKPVTFAECRYVLIMHTTGGRVTRVLIKRGRDLAAWDRTGTKTIKWQATITAPVRSKYAGSVVVGADRLVAKLRVLRSLSKEQKLVQIKELDNSRDRPLIKQKPDPRLVYTIEEISELIAPLLGWRMPDPGSYGTRPVGQAFEKEVASTLGYVHVGQTDTGDIPDLLHQLLEAKFQFSPTIDLGRYLPVDRAPLEEQWNQFRLQPRDLRYLVALGSLEGGYYEVDGLVLISGDEFPEHFSLVQGRSFKVQLRIPQHELVD